MKDTVRDVDILHTHHRHAHSEAKTVLRQFGRADGLQVLWREDSRVWVEHIVGVGLVGGEVGSGRPVRWHHRDNGVVEAIDDAIGGGQNHPLRQLHGVECGENFWVENLAHEGVLVVAGKTAWNADVASQLPCRIVWELDVWVPVSSYVPLPVEQDLMPCLHAHVPAQGELVAAESVAGEEEGRFGLSRAKWIGTLDYGHQLPSISSEQHTGAAVAGAGVVEILQQLVDGVDVVHVQHADLINGEEFRLLEHLAPVAFGRDAARTGLMVCSLIVVYGYAEEGVSSATAEQAGGCYAGGSTGPSRYTLGVAHLNEGIQAKCLA